MRQLPALPSRDSRLPRHVLAGLLAAAVSSPLTALATTDNWTSATSANFTTGPWSPGLPGSADTANFNVAGAYTVTFTNSPTNAALNVSAGNVTFATNGSPRTYTISGNISLLNGGETLTLGSSAAALQLNTGGLLMYNASSLSILAGNSLTAGTFFLGGNAAGTATTNVSGSGSALHVTGSTVLGIQGCLGNLTIQNSASASFVDLELASNGGAGSAGTFTVKSSANVTSSGNILVATQTFAGMNASILVTGGATFTQTGATALIIGAASTSTASLTVDSSAIFSTGTGLTTVNATGSISLTNAGTFYANGNVTVNGGTIDATSGNYFWNAANTTMSIQSGGKVTLSNGIETPANANISISGAGSQLNVNGPGADLYIDNGGALSATSGAAVSSTIFFDVGFIGNGTATFDGNGTSLSALSGNNTIGSGGTGTLTFSNNSIGSTGGFSIGSANGSHGTLNVQSGAVLTSGTITIATSATTTTGAINVTGGNLTMTGASTLTLGAASLSSANITVGAAGIFSTGTGLTTINPTGNINITGGTFNLKGNLTVTGGTLSQSSGTFTWAASHNMTIQSAGHVTLFSIFTTPTNASILVTGAGSQLNDSGGVSDLTIAGGSLLTVNSGGLVHSDSYFDVGNSSNGTATFDGANTSLTAGQGGNFIGALGGTGTLTFSNGSIGNTGGFNLAQVGGNGTLNVQSNATLTTGTIDAADSNINNSTAAINVNGGTLTQTGSSNLTVGQSSAGSAIVTISNGTYSTGTGLTTINLTGQINIAGGNFNLNGDLTVTGGSLTQSSGTFSWAVSHNMTIQSGGHVTVLPGFAIPTNANISVTGAGSQLNETGADLAITNGATLSVTSGGSVSSSGFFDTGVILNGTATFDGANSSLTAPNGGNFIGVGGATGALTFSNNSVGSTGGFFMADASGSNATLNVQSNATLTTGSIDLADQNSNATGTINVNGGTLTQTGTSFLTLGSASKGSAIVTVGSGGIFSTGTGLTTINPTGQINITGGTFILNGDLAVTGGSLNESSGSFIWTTSHNMTIQSAGIVSVFSSFNTPTNANISVSGAGSQLNETGASTSFLGIRNATTLSVTSGASVHTAGAFNVGVGGSATFDGANTSLSANSTVSNNIGASGAGSLTFSNSASGSVPGGYTIGQAASSNGTLNVLSSATFTTGNLTLANVAANATAFVLVGGGTLTQTGAATLTVGASSASTASITIGLNGVFTTGTGNVIINPTGQIHINLASSVTEPGSFAIPGTFTLNGPLTNNGIFSSSGTLNANANITNAANFTQSGPQSWANGTTFTNTAGSATFGSNLKLFGLTISGGTVDITNAKLIDEASSPATTANAYLTLRGYISAHSLISSTLPANFGLALAANSVLASPFSTFGGNPVDSNSVLLSAELLGDSDLSGKVDLTDLSTVLNNFGSTTPAWTSGNFDNQPTINLTDLSDVLNNFGATNPNASLSDSVSAAIATPEPTSLTLLALGTAALLLRKRRPI